MINTRENKQHKITKCIEMKFDMRRESLRLYIWSIMQNLRCITTSFVWQLGYLLCLGILLESVYMLL